MDLQKKVGILTFHSAHNYGAVLQCYALQEYLRGKGFDVEVIDYSPKYIANNYTLSIFDHLKNNSSISVKIRLLISKFLTYNIRNKRFKKFEYFIHNKLRLSKETFFDKNIDPNYDAYIFGSDQIWNPKITEGFDPIFFGQFNSKSGSLKISYAASMETEKLSETEIEFFKKSLENLSVISVREKSLADLLQPISSKLIKVVLDPTLIVSTSVYESIIQTPKIKKKYILTYQVIRDAYVESIAHKLAQDIGAEVINIKAEITPRDLVCKVKSPSVEEFLGLIKYAECIVTTSFHGTVFSILFQKKFHTVANRKGQRSIDLLNYLGLNSRIVKDINNIDQSNINYETVMEKLGLAREESTNYLLNALKF